jgi:pimeloyl-ACP methyl ester carboxylesterase
MATRPLAIAFDVIETMFALEPLRQRIITAGQPGHLLELWFARLLRDAFALAAAGGYRPFAELATQALASATGHTLPHDLAREIAGGFAELDPHPDVEPALRRAHAAGVRVVTLTNGSAHTTATLLRRAGVDQQAAAASPLTRPSPGPCTATCPASSRPAPATPRSPPRSTSSTGTRIGLALQANRRLLHNAEFTLVPRAGHFIALERPDVPADLLNTVA